MVEFVGSVMGGFWGCGGIVGLDVVELKSWGLEWGRWGDKG